MDLRGRQLGSLILGQFDLPLQVFGLGFNLPLKLLDLGELAVDQITQELFLDEIVELVRRGKGGDDA